MLLRERYIGPEGSVEDLDHSSITALCWIDENIPQMLEGQLLQKCGQHQH